MRRTPCSGITLIELLIGIGVIGVMLSLLLPAVQNARAAAIRTDCANRMRQIGIALHQYHDSHGRLPNGSRKDYSPVDREFDPQPGASWLARILPFLEQDNLAELSRQSYKQNLVPWSAPHQPVLSKIVPAFICPADGRLQQVVAAPSGHFGGLTSYVGVQGGFTAELNGMLGFRPGIRLTDVPDGTSTTVMVGERPPSPDFGCGWWYTTHPSGSDLYFDHDLAAESALFSNSLNCGGHTVQTSGGVVFKIVYSPGRINNPCDKYHFWSLHTGGANFVFGDASVRFIPYFASPLLRALATRNGGESVTLP